jgi:hypothetical protein
MQRNHALSPAFLLVLRIIVGQAIQQAGLQPLKWRELRHGANSTEIANRQS